MIYLDHAATTPVAREVADTMYDVLLNGSGNPSSQYPYGAAAKKRLEADRAVIAAALGCKPDELYFTSCGTESDNWAIRLAAHQNRRVGKHIITTAVEHSAVLEPCRQLEQEGYAVTYLAPDRQGNITAQQVADALREDTALVSVMLVNNETGCVFPVAEIARLLREHGSKALLHTDAVQAFLKLPFRADTLGADLISVSGHKLNAPKGVGALYIGPRCRAVRPLLAGGGQERGLRSGTEATAQIAGFAKAVELRLEGYEEKLAQLLVDQIAKQNNVANNKELENIGFFSIDEIFPNGNFMVDETGITYSFNEYEIAAYVVGATHVQLPYKEIRHLLRDDSPISSLID